MLEAIYAVYIGVVYKGYNGRGDGNYYNGLYRGYIGVI